MRRLRWAPAGLLLFGALFTVGMDAQRSMPLREPLDRALPLQLAGYVGKDVEISEAEQEVAGMSSYVMRSFAPRDSLAAGAQTAGFSVYVGYYEQQTQGRTIHSPKNCLPGSGWEALVSQQATIETASGPEQVNRYLLQRDEQRALVLYWYQGRGRIEANEYRVKLDLLRDAAVRRRSDEALVRIVVPVQGSEEEALALATRLARDVAPAVERALPL